MISILAVIYVVFVSLGLPDSVFGVSWPVIHLEFGIDEGFASVYSIVTGICSGLSSFFAGFFLRKFGTAIVTFVSIVFTAIGLLGMSFSPNIFVMMAFAVILGFGAGAIDTGLNNFVSLHYKASHMSWLHCFWGVGVTTSPLIMSAFLGGQNGGWRSGYRVLVVLRLVIAAITFLSLKKWRSFENESKTQTLNATETDGEASKNDSKKFSLFSFKGLLPGVLSMGFYTAMEFTISTWGATYLVNTLSLGAEIASKIVSFFFFGIMLGRLVSGFVSEKAGDNNLIRFGMLFSLFGVAFLLFKFSIAPYIGLFLIGFGFAPTFPSIIHAVPVRFGKEFSSDLTGIHMGGGYAIGYVFSLAYGFVASKTTFSHLPFILIILVIIVISQNELAILRSAKNKTV